MFSHPDYDGHEALLFAQDTASGLRALIAIHDTTLGPAFGGCRMYPYVSEQHAMTDVLRLSRGMTYKAAICGLPYGGGKSVIIADPCRDKPSSCLCDCRPVNARTSWSTGANRSPCSTGSWHQAQKGRTVPTEDAKGKDPKTTV